MPPYNIERAPRLFAISAICARIIRSRVAIPPVSSQMGSSPRTENDALTSQCGRQCLVSDHWPPNLMYKLRATRRVSARAWRWS
jgi:hypothetical protein